MMWILRAEDIRTAKANVSRRRAELEAELKNLDAELATLDDIERTAKSFMTKYQSGDVGASVNGKSNDQPQVDRQVQGVPQQGHGGLTNWGTARLTPAGSPNN